MSDATPVDTVDTLADYVSGITFDDLPEPVVHAAIQRLIDTIGCAVGGARCEAADVGRRISTRVDAASTPTPGRPIGGSARRTSLEDAGFVNTAMIRYLDFNDIYPGGHPSDALGPMIAVADAIGSSGKELLTALVASYDIFIRQATAATLRERGWDQGFGIGLATAAGTSMLLGLDRESTRQALAISAVANVPLRATRAGRLSAWKGAATAYSAKGALFGTLLAAQGLTGPEAPIDGRHGLKDLVTGPFELSSVAEWGTHLTDWARLKYWPVEGNLQAVVWAAIELRDRLGGGEFESVDIQTYWSAWHETGSEPAKWDPQTRETADHSMPYVFVKAFQTGTLDLTAFEPSAYLDPEIRPMLDRVSIRVDDEIEAAFPSVVRTRVVAKDRDGNEHVIEITNPRGHESNPMSDDDVDTKFRRLMEPEYGQERTDETLGLLWKAPTTDRFSDVLDLLAKPDFDVQ